MGTRKGDAHVTLVTATVSPPTKSSKMAEASFKDIPELFEVRAILFALYLSFKTLLQVDLGESLTARTEALCMSDHLHNVNDV